jgi:hypothetical protein
MKSQQEADKALVVEAFDTLFNKRDYAAAEKFWSAAVYPTQRPYRAGKGGTF